MSLPHPIVDDVPGVRESVCFIKQAALEQLPTPWPRCQDLPASAFSLPEKDDFVVAVSHAWPYQAHPDPLGEKCAVLRDLTVQACAVHKPRGRTLFFVDFLSATQRPFARGQANRTKAQDDAFATALKAFPLIYLVADATFHIDMELSDVPEEPVAGVQEPVREPEAASLLVGAGWPRVEWRWGRARLPAAGGAAAGEDLLDYTVHSSELRGVQLQVVGPAVQCVDFRESGGLVAPFDVVASIGNSRVRSLEDVDRLPGSPGPWGAGWLCCQTGGGPELEVAHLRRAPYGRRNALPAGVKGWIFLERFVSMVKSAMVPESRAASVAFSNSEQVLREIFAGGARLRAANAGGPARLQATLEDFARELDAKQFSATSLDKVMNTGGVGGMKAAPSVSALDRINATAYAASDRDVVWELMQILVEHLTDHWEAEAAAQRQRQLVLAVCRGDTVGVTQLIEAGADPNAPDLSGRTSLHAAATFRQVEMARTLLQHRADTMAEDRLGNLPIHLLSFISQQSTIELFDLLAPSKLELAKANVAGISPLKKLAAWVEVECRSAPFPPAQKRLEELRALYPEVLFMPTPGAVTRSGLSLGPAVRGVEHRTVGGRSISIPVWEPAGQAPAVHVAFFALMGVVPWSLTEIAAGLIAECVCHRFGAKLWVITTEALDARTVYAEESPVSKLHDALEEVINALPLGDRFFMMESSIGFATPMVWRLHDRLLGALLINPCGFFSEEFEGSQMHTIFAGVLAKQLDLARTRDPEKQTVMLAQWSGCSRYEDLVARFADYKVAWAAAPESRWLCWEYGNMDLTRLTRLFWKLPLLPAVPVTFALGSLAPTPFVAEPVTRFQKLLPNSTVAYIPDSKMLWDFEGEQPMCKVAALLCELMERELARRIAP